MRYCFAIESLKIKSLYDCVQSSLSGVVELMAGGTIVLAHNSGGPKLDIVCECASQSTGFLADDVSSYAKSMHDIFSMSRDERTRMQLAARKATLRFSDQHFEDCFIDCIQNLNGLQQSILSCSVAVCSY